MPFVKPSSRHLCAPSLPVLQICKQVYINSPETVSSSFLKPPHKTPFCYNASLGHDGDQTCFLRGCTGCRAAGWRGCTQHRATVPSLCTWDRSCLSLWPENRDGGLSGKAGASVRGVIPHSPTLLPFLGSAPSMSLCHFCLLLELRDAWDSLFVFRVLHAWTSATVLHSSRKENYKQMCPLCFAVATRQDLSKSSTLCSLGAQSPLQCWVPQSPCTGGATAVALSKVEAACRARHCKRWGK